MHLRYLDNENFLTCNSASIRYLLCIVCLALRNVELFTQFADLKARLLVYCRPVFLTCLRVILSFFCAMSSNNNP